MYILGSPRKSDFFNVVNAFFVVFYTIFKKIFNKVSLKLQSIVEIYNGIGFLSGKWTSHILLNNE